MNAPRPHSPTPVVLPQLTPKQREVMTLVADHRTSKEIAGLLGISESAVNQRIELIRARLGGLPRGEMARLYRQEFARQKSIAATYPPIWEKIQVQSSARSDHGVLTEGRPGDASAVQQYGARESGVGSQPSRPFLPAAAPRAGREEHSFSARHILMVGLLILSGIAMAAVVTEMVGVTQGG